MDVADLIAQLRPRLAGAVVATDFDGTLAPLQKDPEQSRPVEGSIEALTALAGAGARVAVITGRDAATVVRLGGLDAVPGITVEGLYGLEQWQGGELTTPDTPESMRALRDRLPDVLARAGADPKVWIEDKRLSLVVHARMADDPDAALATVRAPVTDLANELGLDAHPGSQVLELRIPDVDKAGALRRVLGEPLPGAALYLGDDLGDVPAFEHLRALRKAGVVAYSVGVLSSQVAGIADAVDVTVPDPDAAVALLAALARD